MEIIDIKTLDLGHVYSLYSIYQSLVLSLESKEVKTAEDENKIILGKKQLEIIEQWSIHCMNDTLHWTREELLLSFGHIPSVIVDFHIGSENFKTYNKPTAITIKFSQEEQLEILKNIKLKSERKSGKVTFKVIKDGSIREMESREIFQISSLKY